MANPFVTIAIPTYNRLTFLPQAYASAKGQTFRDFEILIGDSSSDDRIADFIRNSASPETRYVRYPASLPLAEKIDAMVGEARGEWMVFLGDDDLLEPDYLRKLSRHIAAYPEASMVRCRNRVIDEDGRTLRKDPGAPKLMPPTEFLKRLSLPERHFFKMNLAGILFSRDKLSRNGGIPHLYKGLHVDYLVWAALGTAGPCVFENESLCRIRVHRHSMTSGYSEDFRQMLRANFQAHRRMARYLGSVAAQPDLTPAESAQIRDARKNLKSYILRHIRRSLDHGYISSLSQEEKQCLRSRDEVERLRRRLKVPAFRSVWVYRLLYFMPGTIRTRAAGWIRDLKVQMRCG